MFKFSQRRIFMRRYLSGFVASAILSVAFAGNQAQAAELGVYQGNGCDGVKKLETFAAWFGRKPDFVLDFFAMDTWDSMYSDAQWALGCWAKQGIKGVWSVPMLVGGTTLAKGAAGEYDAQFIKLAQLLVSKGYGNSTIRLGWEFNGGWYVWAAKSDPTNWVKYWQRIVTTMRSVSGANFKFDWCSAQGTQQIAPDKLYPGDAYVDYIGRDTYNQTWTTNIVTPEQRWNEQVTMAYGLNWLKDFAKQHNKPITMAEWGTGTRPDGHGGGDDGYFVTKMAQWMKDNNVAYHSYWDYPASDYNAKLSDGHQPNAGAAFLAAYKSVPDAPTNVVAAKSN